jgi:hypothetical protein
MSNYSWQKSISVLLCWRCSAQMFSLGCFVFNGEHFRHPPCPEFSVAKFSDDGYNHQFSNQCFGA